MLNNVVLRVLETERRAHAEDETERSIGSKDPFVLIVTAKKLRDVNCARDVGAYDAKYGEDMAGLCERMDRE